MNQCFETESGQSESVSITAIEGHSITKEAFEKATDEPNNEHEKIPSKLPSEQNNNSDKHVEIIDLTEDQNTIGGLQNTLVRKRQKPKLSWSRDGIYSCKYCKQTCRSQGAIMRHVNEVHLKMKPYSCPHCKHSSSRESDLARHIKAVHLKLKSFKCNKCKYAAVNKYELKYHVKRMHNKKQKSYHCDKCKSVFEDRLQLKAHLKKVHLNEKPYKCSECKRQFSTKRKLQNHVKKIHVESKRKIKHPKNSSSPCINTSGAKKFGVKNSELTCQYCDKSFSSKSYVESHQNIVHFKLNPYSCHDCGASFLKKSLLKSHIKNTHVNNRDQKYYNCDSCKIYFIQEKNLKQHVSETHENSKPTLKWVKPLLPGPLVFINDLKNTPMLSGVQTIYA